MTTNMLKNFLRTPENKSDKVTEKPESSNFDSLYTKVNQNSDILYDILTDEYSQENNIRKDIISLEIVILILFVFVPVLFYITGNLKFD